MDRRAKVELFEKIRSEYEHGDGTIRGIAKKLGIHRRMVREAVLSAVPIERKTPVRERPKLEPVMTFIDTVLEGERKRRENSGTPHIGSGAGSEQRCRKCKWPSPRFVGTFAYEKRSWR